MASNSTVNEPMEIDNGKAIGAVPAKVDQTMITAKHTMQA